MSSAKQKSALQEFRTVLGTQAVVTDPQEMSPFLTEWRDKYVGQAAAILRPSTVEHLSEIVKIANRQHVFLVPQGGNTGLVGGQIAFDAERQFVVSLSRLNKIREIDPAGYTLTAEAGCILQKIQEAADTADRLFPLSLSAEGSCQIGGNLSSNAGGTGALAYGTARDMVWGIEAVLPNGEIYQGLNRLKKDNTGYDLKNLFIGAEGTLGFITAAVLKLFPKPRGMKAALLGFSHLSHVAQFYEKAQTHAGVQLTAFEIMPEISMDFLTRHVEGARNPLSQAWPWYILIEISSNQSIDHANQLLMTLLEEGMENSQVDDGVVATSETQRRFFWHLRHELSDVQKREGGSIKHDISVPVAALPTFLDNATKAARKLIPACRPVPFGHWGDGNIHFNISQPIGMDKDLFLAHWNDMNECIHDVVLAHGGSISAEHGIGVMKREKLAKVKDPVALSMMRQIKKALDPNGIMNPDKVL